MMDDLLKSHIEWLRGDHELCNPFLADRIEALEARAEKAEAERDALREALAFYADRENWRQMSVSEFREKYPSQDPSVSIRGDGREVYALPGRCLAATELDHGRLARAALNAQKDRRELGRKGENGDE